MSNNLISRVSSAAKNGRGYERSALITKLKLTIVRSLRGRLSKIFWIISFFYCTCNFFFSIINPSQKAHQCENSLSCCCRQMRPVKHFLKQNSNFCKNGGKPWNPHASPYRPQVMGGRVVKCRKIQLLQRKLEILERNS